MDYQYDVGTCIAMPIAGVSHNLLEVLMHVEMYDEEPLQFPHYVVFFPAGSKTVVMAQHDLVELITKLTERAGLRLLSPQDVMDEAIADVFGEEEPPEFDDVDFIG